MEKKSMEPKKRKSGLSMHFILATLCGLLFYLFVNIYVKQFTNRDNEEISFASTIFFIGSVYTGRFLSQLLIPKSTHVPLAPFVILPLIITACIFLCVQFAGSLLSHTELMYALFLAFPFFILCLASGMLIKLVRERIKNQLQEAQATIAHSQSELHLLQSQLSPHFLFNTLNNMYGISITQHEKLPGLLLKLSDLLRYSVYETKELFVPLKDELTYINNYIDFETIRLGERLVLTTNIEDTAGLTCKIPPMLLIIFVENAFKHSKNSSEEKIFIDIALKIWANSILFSVKNSHQVNKSQQESSNDNSGFGLANARKRLELLYPNEFDLKLTDDGEFYLVALRLNIK